MWTYKVEGKRYKWCMWRATFELKVDRNNIKLSNVFSKHDYLFKIKFL